MISKTNGVAIGEGDMQLDSPLHKHQNCSSKFVASLFGEDSSEVFKKYVETRA